MKPLRCRCGQVIGLDDLMHIAYHPHTMGANRIQVRFECPKCGRVSERLLPQAVWDEMLLAYLENDERTLNEWMETTQLGPITDEEIRAMRRELRQGDLLRSLRKWEASQGEPQD